jgi:hypothetical protein
MIQTNTPCNDSKGKAQGADEYVTQDDIGVQ